MNDTMDETKNKAKDNKDKKKETNKGTLTSTDTEEEFTGEQESNHDSCQQRIQELETQNSSMEKKLREQEQRYLYLYSDFENFRKRMSQERQEWINFGWQPLAKDLIEVIDNIERAIYHLNREISPKLKEGLFMTLNQLKAVLEKHGIKRLPTTQEPFNPEVHEAIGKDRSDLPQGTVLREERSGYSIHGRLLRPAQVIVSAENGEKTKESAA